ncbi:MAG: FlgD immunoglobulin-like domain containing protein, partial [bacterium]
IEYSPPGTYSIMAFIDTNNDHIPDVFGTSGDSVINIGNSDTLLNFDIAMKMKPVGSGSISGNLALSGNMPVNISEIRVMAVPIDSAIFDSVLNDRNNFKDYIKDNFFNTYIKMLDSVGPFSLTGLVDTCYLVIASVDTGMIDSTGKPINQGEYAGGPYVAGIGDSLPTLIKISNGAGVTGINITIRPDGNVDLLDRIGKRIPKVFSLAAPAPNPFNPVVMLGYSIPIKSVPSICIYNSSGQLIRTLAEHLHEPGYYRIFWNGKNNQGKSVSSGMYICRMQAGKFLQQRRLIMLK